VPLALGTLALAALVRVRPAFRVLDIALMACLIVTAAQLLPLPAGTRLWLSPATSGVDQALFLDASASGPSALTRPLSLDPENTVWTLALGATLVMLFWGARAAFERGGALRVTCRGIAWLGMVLSAVVFVQRSLSPELIYGFWRPIARIDHPRPIGPFLNRNDLATWLIIAIPLVLGYALARLSSRDDDGPLPIDAVFDARTVVLAGSLCLMIAALLATESRSGLVGLGTALVLLLWLARGRLPGRGFNWLIAAVCALFTAATAYANVPSLSARLGDSFSSGLGGRLDVWRETWPMVRDFPWAGIGAGAFERGMSVYQQSTRLLFFNHAHNEYLHLLAEGGVAIAVPVVLVLGAGAWGMASRLRRDTTPAFWMRAGAAAGVAAAAVQSVWNTGLRMPASGVLFAVAAAMALHRSHYDMSRMSHRKSAA
jgi:O-antigen ligase